MRDAMNEAPRVPINDFATADDDAATRVHRDMAQAAMDAVRAMDGASPLAHSLPGEAADSKDAASTARRMFPDDEVTMQHHLQVPAGDGSEAGAPVPQASASAPATTASAQLATQSQSANDAAQSTTHLRGNEPSQARAQPAHPQAHAQSPSQGAASAAKRGGASRAGRAPPSQGQRFDDLDEETRVLADEPEAEGQTNVRGHVGRDDVPAEDTPREAQQREPNGARAAEPQWTKPAAKTQLPSVPAVMVAVFKGTTPGEAKIVVLEPGSMPPDGTAMAILVPMSEMDGAALSKLFGLS